MKRGILFFICFIIVILSIFLFEFVVYGGGMDYKEDLYKELKEGEILYVRDDNSISIKNYDKIATTGTKYRTLGYGIKKQRKVLLKQRTVKLMRRYHLCSINH